VHGTTAKQVHGTTAKQVHGTTAKQVHGTTAKQVHGTTAKQVHGTTAKQVHGTTAKQVHGTIDVQFSSRSSKIRICFAPRALPTGRVRRRFIWSLCMYSFDLFSYEASFLVIFFEY